jgi:hypothetical protein
MHIKIVNEKSNWYLIRKNVAVWFTALALASLLNWDLLITRYNLTNKPLAQVDLKYLFTLSASNIPELIEITKTKEFMQLDKNLRDGSSPFNYQKRLGSKIRSYLNDYSDDWQSWDLRDKRITTAIMNY